MGRKALPLALAGAILAAVAAAAVGAIPNNIVSDGVDANENVFLSKFPYVAASNSGYDHTEHEEERGEGSA